MNGFKSNCYIWAIQQRLTRGGKLNLRRTVMWRGPHMTWTDNDGVEWEFTFIFARPRPWWYIPFYYKGVVKKRC